MKNEAPRLWVLCHAAQAALGEAEMMSFSPDVKHETCHLVHTLLTSVEQLWAMLWAKVCHLPIKDDGTSLATLTPLQTSTSQPHPLHTSPGCLASYPRRTCPS